MNIDKEKIKIGIWYEDIYGKMYRFDVVPTDESCKKLYGISLYDLSYHVSFPLEVCEKIAFPGRKDCKHPRRMIKRTDGWEDGIKGCKCTACGSEKIGKSYIPFAFMKWEENKDIFDGFGGFSSNTHLSRDSGKTIVAMVNSGDYELDEAMAVYSQACERCMNVLDHKYCGGDEGYEEFSDEWKKANTHCEFCKGL